MFEERIKELTEEQNRIKEQLNVLKNNEEKLVARLIQIAGILEEFNNFNDGEKGEDNGTTS